MRKIIITRRVPCRHQNLRTKKVPQFSSFKFTPATAPAESCCTDHNCAGETVSAEQPLNGARYSWQVEGMDCAACARKVETAVRQIDGVSRYRCYSLPRNCWSMPTAISVRRLKTRYAPRVIPYAMLTRRRKRNRKVHGYRKNPGVIESGSDDGAQLGAGAV